MGGTRSVSQESVRVRVKLSRRAVARASRPHPRPPRMGTRVGGTARLQSAAPTTHTRSVSRRRRADNPDRGDEGARRRQEGKKGLLDSRLREPLRPHSGSGASGKQGTWTRIALRTCTPGSPSPRPRRPPAPVGGPRNSRPHQLQLTSSSATVGIQSPRPPPPPDPRLSPEARPHRAALRPLPHVLAQAVGTQRH